MSGQRAQEEAWRVATITANERNAKRELRQRQSAAVSLGCGLALGVIALLAWLGVGR